MELGLAVDSGLAESRKLGADAKMKKIEAIAIQAKRSRIWCTFLLIDGV